jgi:hypothetical protein
MRYSIYHKYIILIWLAFSLAIQALTLHMAAAAANRWMPELVSGAFTDHELALQLHITCILITLFSLYLGAGAFTLTAYYFKSKWPFHDYVEHLKSTGGIWSMIITTWTTRLKISRKTSNSSE